MRCPTHSKVSFINLYEVISEDEEKGLEDTELENDYTIHKENQQKEGILYALSITIYACISKKYWALEK